MVVAVISSVVSGGWGLLLATAPVGRGQVLVWLAIALVAGALAAALHAAKADGRLDRPSPLGRRRGGPLPPPD